MSLFSALGQIPILVGEAQALETEIKEGIAVTTPGVPDTIAGVHGKLSLTFTPDSVAPQATS